MGYETINKETLEMKQPISGTQEISNRFQEIAQTHRLSSEGGEKSTSGDERSVNNFPSALIPRRTIGTKTLLPTPKIAVKILYRLSNLLTKRESSKLIAVSANMLRPFV